MTKLSMSDHLEIQKRLAIYRDLTENERQQVDHHIKHCSACATKLTEYETFDQTLSLMTRSQPKPGFRPAFYNQLERQATKSHRIRLLKSVTTVAVPLSQVAVTLLLVYVLWVAIQGQLKPTSLSPALFAPSPLPPTELHYLYPENDNLASQLQRTTLKKFEVKEPTFRITAQSFNPDRLDQTLNSSPVSDIVAIQLGVRTDIIVEQNQVLEISDLWLEQDWTNAYSKQARQLGTVNGKQYFLPVAYTWFGIYYYKPTFEKHQLTPPEDWASFLTTAETLKQSDVIPILRPKQSIWPSTVWFDYLDIRLNGPAFHRRLMQGQESFDTPQVKRVFETWQMLLNQGYFVDSRAFYDFDDTLNAMIDGQVGMVLMTPLVMESIPDEILANFEFFQFPIINPTLPVGEELSTLGYFIPANSEQPEAAKTFLKQLGSAERQREIMAILHQETSYLPAHKNFDISQLSSSQQQGFRLVQTADEVIHSRRSLDNSSLNMGPYIEQSIDKFLNQPDNIDAILTALEEVRRAISDQ